MGRCRVVVPETTTIPISDGDWLEVKKRLTYGETAKSRATLVKEVREDGRMTPDFELVEIAQVLTYLVDWSLCDEKGKRIPIDTDRKKLAGIFQQDPDTIREIVAAVGVHAEAMEKEVADAKNGRSGETSSTLSASVA